MTQKENLQPDSGSLSGRKWRYVICYGILGWGVLAASALSLFQQVIGSDVSLPSFLLKLLIFSVLGVTLALWNWSRANSDVYQ